MSEAIPNGVKPQSSSQRPSNNRGGRGGNSRGGFRGGQSRAAPSRQQQSSAQDESDDAEVQALRSKYGKDQLPLIKELFQDWSDEVGVELTQLRGPL